jgi:hypothetical protein
MPFYELHTQWALYDDWLSVSMLPLHAEQEQEQEQVALHR